MSSGKLCESPASVAAEVRVVCANIDRKQWQSVAEALSLHGLTPVAVPQNASLSDIASHRSVDSILIGASSHDQSFFEILAQLKSHDRLSAIPILALTEAGASQSWITRVLQAGADDLIEVSLPSAVLGRRVAAMAALCRQHRTSSATEFGHSPSGESLPVVVYVRSPEPPYPYLYVSPNINAFGYSQEEWYQSKDLWMSLIHREDRGRILETVAGAAIAGGDYDLEYRIRGKDDAAYWVIDRGRCVRDSAGKIESCRGVIFDISTRRRTEDDLRRSEQRYRAVVDQSVVGIYLLDVETKRVIDANPAFSTLLGYDAEEIRGLSLYDIAAHPKDEVDRNVSRVISNQHAYVGERQYRRKDYSIVYLDVSANLVRFEDREVFCVSCSDISKRRIMETSLRRSEAHFRSLIENALDLITIVDSTGLMLYQAPSIEKALGYKPEELVGKSAFEFIHPEDRGFVGDALGRIIESPGTTESSVFRFRRKDGSWRVLEAFGKTPPESTGISGVVVNSRDITDRKQLQEQLIRSEKLAAMGQLVSGVAHELNNPLTSVIGFTQLMMATGELDAKSLERLEIIRSQADRARRIVQNLLSFSRQKKPERTEVDVNRLLEKVLELRAYYMQVNNIVVMRDFGQMPAAFADAPQIEQVFLNIIINAEQAILGVRRGGTIAISTSLGRFAGQPRIRIRIADDGPGITPEFLGKIFDPFFTTKNIGEGTGLGLSVSYGIIKEHGGSLEVSSEPGIGTTFIVELPAAAVAGASSDPS